MRMTRNVLVPFPDGSEIAADLYLPDEPGPFAALLSFYPYRKDDLIGATWAYPIRELVTAGYAHVLADFRGLGSSSGVSSEAMSFSEASDGVAIVEWMARQPWCDGNVGMWGVSYGGITAFQTASLRPPNLRAIASVYANLDTYHHFHYPGGCFNCLSAMGSWGPFMLALQLAPPMHHDPDGRWYEVWRQRLEQSEPYLSPWQEHPARDEYWQKKSIPARSIEVPTLLVGGWRDIFLQAMVDAYSEIEAPRKLWMGPWLHAAPDSSPFVAVEYVPALRRWFDRWLRIDGRVLEDEPPVTVYVQGHKPGWRHDRDWPFPGVQETTLFLGAEAELLMKAPSDEASLTYAGDPTVGVQAGLWDAKGIGIGMPLDQRSDDDRSLAFTSEPLSELLELAGSPLATLFVAVEHGEDVNLVVKLCDVTPDGFSALITSGWLRGSHRVSHEAPSPPPIGELLQFDVQLWATSYRIAPGHKLRVAVSCADFPRIWPTRRNPLIRLSMGGDNPSRINLPVIFTAGVPGIDPVAADENVNRSPLSRDSRSAWRIERDIPGDGVAVITEEHGVTVTPGGDGRLAYVHTARAAVASQAPHGARVEASTHLILDLPSGGEASVTVESNATLEGFSLDGRVEINGKPFFAKTWKR